MRFAFRCADADVLSVELDCDAALLGPRAFERVGDLWTLDFPRPPVQRMEYRFRLRGNEQHLLVPDPANLTQVETVFGQRSVLEFPGYQTPWWRDAPRVEGTFAELTVAGETSTAVPLTIWQPEGVNAADPLPLLLVHDGPEYAQLADLTTYSGALIAAGVVPRHRLALARPVLRDAWYSASPAYLRTITGPGLDRITQAYAVCAPIVVMGASLGGLTSLLAALQGNTSIGGVFAQSGSFFQPRTDPMEAGFRYFDRVAARVGEVLDTRHTDHPLRIGMTCGALEENAANNRQMAAALHRAGHRVSYAEGADLHNYTAWRDSLDPHLTSVLVDLWR